MPWRTKWAYSIIVPIRKLAFGLVGTGGQEGQNVIINQPENKWKSRGRNRSTEIPVASSSKVPSAQKFVAVGVENFYNYLAGEEEGQFVLLSLMINGIGVVNFFRQVSWRKFPTLGRSRGFSVVGASVVPGSRCSGALVPSWRTGWGLAGGVAWAAWGRRRRGLEGGVYVK